MSDLPVLISTHKLFVIFSLPCPAEEGSDRAALVGTWCPARVNPPQGVSLEKEWSPLPDTSDVPELLPSGLDAPYLRTREAVLAELGW